MLAEVVIKKYGMVLMLASSLVRRALFPVLDMSCVYFSGVVLYAIRVEDSSLFASYQLLLLFICFLIFNVSHWFSLYSEWRGQSFLKEAVNIVGAFAVLSLILSLALFVLKEGASFSRLWVTWTIVSGLFLVLIYRYLIRVYFKKARLSGKNLKRVVIVGAGVLGKRACNAMLSQSWSGFQPIAFFDDEKALEGQTHKGVPVIGNVDEVVSFIESCRASASDTEDKISIDQVWIALPLRSQKRIEELQMQLGNTATNVFFIPDLYGFNLANYEIEERIGLQIMNMSASPMEGGKAFVKRLEDILISSIMLVVLSPIFLIISILVKLESPGPVFFKQRRYGVDGKEISVWKFRSMKVLDDGEEVKQAQRSDPRVTKFGGFLRKSSLDELPQLINVLQGVMSLVGPRPHAVAHNEFYRQKIQGYMERHKIRPGITGWAQVNGCRGETAKLSDMEERVRYDLEYIKNWSLRLDVLILFRTIKTVIDNKDTY